MKILNFRHLSILVPSLAVAVGIINFAGPKRSYEGVPADELPESELYFAPAVTTNTPHTYSNSPTNEPWYSTKHSYRNTSDPNNKLYDFCQRDTTYSRMNVASTWESYRGESVKVAVIDTGCAYQHEDFSGTNFSTYSKNMVSGSTGIEAANDTNGHGSSSASTIAAAINAVGGAGIAPNVELIVLKCVDSNNTFSNTSISNALQYCIDNDVDVINMSIQGYSTTFSASWTEDFGEVSVSTTSTGIMSSTYLKSKLDACYEAGITVVAAAGNYNTNRESYPAANDHVIAVASTGLLETNKLNKAGFSNYGDWVDICAPGYITTPTITYQNSYSINYGTSFSSPLVAGAIALYKSKYPTATPDQIEEALKHTATPINWNGGAGAINVGAFLAAEPDQEYVESVSLAESTKTLTAGNTYQLQPTVLPSGADQNVTYESSDNTVATVNSNGLVTAIKSGDAQIVCYSAENKNIYDTVLLTIKAGEDTPTLYKTIVFTSSTMQKGVTSYTSSFTNISDGITSTVQNANNNNKGWDYIKIGRKDNASTGTITNNTSIDKKIAQVDITFGAVNNVENANLYVSANSDFYSQSSYSFTPAVGKVSVSISTPIANGYYKIEIACSSAKSNGPVIISQIDFLSGGGSTPSTKTLSSIAVTSSSHRTFVQGDNFVNEEITAYYSDSSTAIVTNHATFSSPNMSVLGIQTVDVSYTEGETTKNTSYTITITSETPVVTNYTVTFNPNGGTGTMANQTTTGQTFTVPTCTFTKTNYVCNSWTLNSTSGTTYRSGDTIYGISQNITLYAVWTEQGGGSDIPAGWYDSITDSMSGDTLLSKLRALNLSKRTSTVGYSSMGTTPSGQFKYTDYDPNYVQYDSNGQPYGTRILSFYSGMSTTAWNREHVWPNSRGGGLVDNDIYMPRPTITAENSNRGNSSYVEGMSHSANGWDPVTAFGANNCYQGEGIRGECARIIFYCMTANASLSLKEGADTSYNNSIGCLSDMLEWNLKYPVNQREVNRQSGGMYLQGNRNAFVDDPGYACRIWGNTNSSTRSICSQTPTPTKTLSSLTFTGAPSKTTYTEGESFIATGLTVTATYEDETTEVVTSSITWTPNPLTAGTTQVIGTYSAGGVTRTITVSGLTVIERQSGGGGQYTIEFEDSSSDGSAAITSSSVILNDHTTTNTLVTSPNGITDITKVYLGTTGLKLGSGSAVGGFNLNLINDAQVGISSISVTSKKYSSDTGVINYTFKNSGSSVSGGSGSFTPPSSTGEQTATFSNPLTANTLEIITSSKRAYIKKIVLEIQSSGPGVHSISIPSSLGLDSYNNPTYTFNPTIDADEGADTTVTWTSSNTSVATITSGGTVTALTEGTTTITAVCGGKTATCTLTVTDSAPKVNSIVLDKNTASIDLYNATTVTLTPTVNADVGADTTVTWTSSNTSVATVSKGSGTEMETITVTAHIKGTAIITATCGEKTATCTITVTDSTPVAVTGVSLNKSTTSLTVGSNETLIATITPSNATDKSVSWSSSVQSVATVNSDGKVTAIATGTTVITVTTTDGNYTATCTVTVTEAPTIEYRLEAQETVPYENGTNKVASISVKLYQYTGGVKGSEVASGTCSVDTSSLGYKELTLAYQSVTYSTQIKVTNHGASDNVGISEGGSQTTSTATYTITSKDAAFSGGINGTSLSKTGTTSYEDDRGMQWSKNTGSITINQGTSSLSSYKIQSVVIDCSANATGGKLSVKVGSTALGSTESISNSNHQTKTFTNSTGLTGNSIRIDITQSSKSTYIKSIEVTYSSGTPGKTYNATPTEQAAAWAEYFIDQTRTSDTCLAPTDADKLVGLKAKWADLSYEYSEMIALSKTEFVDSTNASIVRARQHYQFIINKFGSDELTPFVTDGSNTLMSTNQNRFGLSITNDASTVVVTVVSLASIASLTSFIYIRKKKVSL